MVLRKALSDIGYLADTSSVLDFLAQVYKKTYANVGERIVIYSIE